MSLIRNKNSKTLDVFKYLLLAYLVITIPARVLMGILIDSDNAILKFQVSGGIRLLLIVSFFIIVLRFKDRLFYPNKIHFLSSAIFIVAPLLMLAVSTNTWHNNQSIGWISIVLVSVTIGIFEEFTFRGIVFSTLNFDKNQLFKAAVISSAAFGLMHLENLWGHEFSSELLTNVLSQVLFAFSIGMLFCGIYAKTGWLLPVILLHTSWDIINISKSKLKIDATNHPGETVTGDPVASAIFGLLILALICGAGYLMLKSANRTQTFEIESGQT